MEFKDITGQKFNRLTAISYSKKHNGKRWRTYWNCKCDCGNDSIVMTQQLTSGQTKSCGCYNRDIHFKHGHTINQKTTPEFASWCAAKSRCFRVKDNHFKDYGGRGITMCAGWKDSFATFFADMGKRPKDTTLDRINNNLSYSCGHCDECISKGWKLNCRWGNDEIQNNNRRDNINITYNGITMTAAQWARIIGVNSSTIARRFAKGVPIDKPQTSRDYYK